MTARDALQRLIAERQRGRVLLIGGVASLVWLALAAILAALTPDDGTTTGGWLLWTVGVLLPLALIWLAVWSAHSLSLLRDEAEELRALLGQMQDGAPAPADSPVADRSRAAPAPVPAATAGARRAASIGVQPSSAAPSAVTTSGTRPAPQARDGRQASLPLDSPPGPELTAPELYFALNFPDGPEDREAIRCLRLALADPGLARLIRAAQDVVTLLAGQGVYMDELSIPETDAEQWRRFAEGARGNAVAGLAVVSDQSALDMAAAMLRSDEVFRDVAHHFLRHFDRLLSRRAEQESPQVLAVLAETRSGRAFILLAQATGMLGQPEDARSA